jgi:hypothetical protein
MMAGAVVSLKIVGRLANVLVFPTEFPRPTHRARRLGATFDRLTGQLSSLVSHWYITLTGDLRLIRKEQKAYQLLNDRFWLPDIHGKPDVRKVPTSDIVVVAS